MDIPEKIFLSVIRVIAFDYYCYFQVAILTALRGGTPSSVVIRKNVAWSSCFNGVQLALIAVFLGFMAFGGDVPTSDAFGYGLSVAAFFYFMSKYLALSQKVDAFGR